MNAGGAGFGHWLAADRTRQHFVHSFCHHPKTSHSEPHGSAVGTFSEGGTAAAIPAGPLSNACASGLEFGSIPSAILCKRALGHNGKRHLMVRTRGSLRHARPTDGTSSPLRQHPHQRQQQRPRRQVALSKAQPRRRSKGSRRRATSPATQVAHKAFFRPRDRLPDDLPAHEARALPWFHDGPVLRSVDTPHLASLSNPIDIDVLRGCVALCAMLAVAGRRW